jgi:hypothetical protein
LGLQSGSPGGRELGKRLGRCGVELIRLIHLIPFRRYITDKSDALNRRDNFLDHK